LAWDPSGAGSNITIKNGSEVLLNESGYIFRSAITKNVNYFWMKYPAIYFDMILVF